MEYGTWLCDQSRTFQSSKSWIYKFMQSYNFIKKKHRNEKDKEPEKIRVICQGFQSYFHHIIFT